MKKLELKEFVDDDIEELEVNIEGTWRSMNWQNQYYRW